MNEAVRCNFCGGLMPWGELHACGGGSTANGYTNTLLREIKNLLMQMNDRLALLMNPVYIYDPTYDSGKLIEVQKAPVHIFMTPEMAKEEEDGSTRPS
jgi:hypothetical protein